MRTWPAEAHKSLARFFGAVGVETRHLALPHDAYARMHGFGEFNRAWQRAALAIGERVIQEALTRAEHSHPAQPTRTPIAVRELSQLTTVTTTGLIVPTLDARWMHRLGLSAHTQRVPLFGLGCAGGVAGLARTADFLRAYPRACALVVAVELCSLTLQRTATDAANLLSSALFADGAAAVLMLGAEHPRLEAEDAARPASDATGIGRRPKVIGSRSVLFEDSESVMGWEFDEHGLHVVLSAEVPQIARTRLAPALDAFLGHHRLRRDDIDTWIAHPGGPKVIDALQTGLQLPAHALQPSRESLARYGNMSSVSVLSVLHDVMHAANSPVAAPAPASHGVMIAMGPGFSAEFVLLRW